MSAERPTVFVSNRQRIVPVAARRVREAALTAADYVGGPAGALSIVIVGDRKMRRLNRDFAGVAGTTDVLAFDLSEGPSGGDDLAGEVVVNASLAKIEAARRRKDPVDELLLYVVHGVLHLGGMRDDRPPARARMRRAESAVLRRLARRRSRRGGS